MRARVEAPPPARDWYWSASPGDRQEYDGFGPWVRDVRGLDDTPRLFRAAWPEHRNARFLLKVPIKADRHDVRPGMALYAMLVAIHDDRMVVFRQTGTGVDARSLDWDEIAVVRSFSDLLAGRLSLLLRDGGTLDIDYNTVSSARLDQVVGFIRDRLVPVATRSNLPPEETPVDFADQFYRNMLRSVRDRTDRPATVLHFEPRNRPCRDDRNRLRLSNGLLIVDATDELVIVDRGIPARRPFHPVYAVSTRFVPYARLTSYAFLPVHRTGPRRLRELVLRADRLELALPCRNAPDAVCACLDRHGIAEIQPEPINAESPPQGARNRPDTA